MTWAHGWTGWAEQTGQGVAVWDTQLYFLPCTPHCFCFSLLPEPSLLLLTCPLSLTACLHASFTAVLGGQVLEVSLFVPSPSYILYWWVALGIFGIVCKQLWRACLVPCIFALAWHGMDMVCCMHGRHMAWRVRHACPGMLQHGSHPSFSLSLW